MIKIPSAEMGTTCGVLLDELKQIWDEIGECDAERDKMLFELEQECLEIYRRKVNQADHCRAKLRQAIAESKAEFAAICSALGEGSIHMHQCNQRSPCLKDELRVIKSQLEEMHNRKSHRLNQFFEVTQQVQEILEEIKPTGSDESFPVDEYDLSLARFEELRGQLQILEQEKANRLQKVADQLSVIDSLCRVLGMNFKKIVDEEISSSNKIDVAKDISDSSLASLSSTIQKLRVVKRQRMDKLQDLASTILELWNLMDTPQEEQQSFQYVTCNIAASENEITEPNALSIDFINHVAAEVNRLQELKSSKMKELVLKKRAELEELLTRAHLMEEPDSERESADDAIETDVEGTPYLLEEIELQISAAKEEAFVRKDVLEKVEKWMAACEEENWLEEYSRDENRYNAGKGTHLALKRAEKARALVSRIPAMVEALVAKTIEWEKERGVEFNYDGVRLLSLLEEYNIMKREKEQERKRIRDQKKLQGQIIAEHETLFGTKPSSPSKNTKKMTRPFSGGKKSSPGAGGPTWHPRPLMPEPTKAAQSTPRKSDEAAAISAA